MKTNHRDTFPDSSIEAEIEVRLWERTLPYIRRTLLAAACLILAFLAWDIRVDPTGQANTVFERVASSAFFALSYLLVSFTRFGRRRPDVIYIVNALMAPVLLLWILMQIPGAYVLAHSAFLAVTMVVMVIGPTVRVSILLVLASLATPNVTVLLGLALGMRLPGLPDAATAVNLALVHLAVSALAVVLILVHTRLQRQVIIDNVQLEQLAGTDPLTAVHNRRQLELEYLREQARQRRHGRDMAVLELDIDHFKKVNDTYGHGVGDEVLRSLSRRWQSLVREVDVLARVGGEEFVLLLPEINEKGARETAERLRSRTAAEVVSTSAGELRVTISIGVTLVEPDGGSLDSIIDRVDHALYEAKRNGRNRCEFIGADGFKPRSGIARAHS